MRDFFAGLEADVEKLKGALAVGVLRLIGRSPWWLVQWLGTVIGWFLWRLPNRSREVVRINIGKCFPELDAAAQERLAKASLRNIAKTLTECACVWMWPPHKVCALGLEFHGKELLDQALASGKGVLMITSHLGNWEWLLIYMSSQCQTTILYRPVKLEALDKLLLAQRARSGNIMLPSNREGILGMVKTLRRGGLVGIAADPEPSPSSGLFAPFYGVPTLTSKFTPSLLRGGKAIGLFMTAVRKPDGRGFIVEFAAAPDELYGDDEQAAVNALSLAMEKQIRAYPEQYMWSMKRFKNRPEGESEWY
jgi:KDO2-lipid IV(A) lauroyltransferase